MRCRSYASVNFIETGPACKSAARPHRANLVMLTHRSDEVSCPLRFPRRGRAAKLLAVRRFKFQGWLSGIL